jgi:FKBP-type peptidyl-prolyl cis-trans isomerase SlyD
MNITNNAIVSMKYAVTSPSGEVLETSGDDPIWYLHGADQLLPGLEKVLESKTIGDEVEVDLGPEEAFGAHEPELISKVPRSELDLPEEAFVVGNELELEDDTGSAFVTITEIAEDMITIDGNHPLAGRAVKFKVEVLEVREATESELEHGHPHPPGTDHDHA